jgi:hypothetical protein
MIWTLPGRYRGIAIMMWAEPTRHPGSARMIRVKPGRHGNAMMLAKPARHPDGARMIDTISVPFYVVCLWIKKIYISHFIFT